MSEMAPEYKKINKSGLQSIASYKHQDMIERNSSIILAGFLSSNSGYQPNLDDVVTIAIHLHEVCSRRCCVCE